jgi:LytR cell envelope-related transcriptional attenuator
LSAESRTRRGDAKIYSAGNGRSPARATALIVGAVIAVVVVLVLVLSSGGGGKTGSQGAAAGQSSEKTVAHTTTSSHTHKQASSHHSESAGTAASPASIAVAVLNGTNTTGLAHSLSKALQQSGYSQATPLSGTPGAQATTLVEYRSGHRADAQAVASALGVTQVQPIETVTASLASTETVVVIAGADKAAAVSETPGGGGASSATSG